MSTSTLVTAATEQEKKILWSDISEVVYQGTITFDASPAAVEIFIGGVANRRLEVPNDVGIVGHYTFSAFNITDGDHEEIRMGEFAIENDGGTTAMVPTNLSATDGNPTVRATKGSGTVAIAANDTEDALTVSYTGTASKVYSVRCRLYGMVAAGDLVVFTPTQNTTSA